MDAITFSLSEETTLRQLGVTGLILFGSRARNLAGNASDYDIGILRVPGSVTRDDKIMYEAIYEVVAGKIQGLVNIDIVFLDAAPLELQMHATRFGKLLFEAQRGVFAKNKEIVMGTYADFAPIRQMFQAQILGRIPA